MSKLQEVQFDQTVSISRIKRWNLRSIIRSITFSIMNVGVLILLPPSAHAYFSVINNGEMVEPQKFQAIIEPQLILSRYDGFNILGRFDTGLTEASSVRGLLGFGKVDFQMGGFYKYIPFPDTANQPAIGGEAGVVFARVSGETEFSIRLNPLVSKRFETEIGDLIPYGSIPFSITSRAGSTIVPVQVVAGGEMRPLNFQNISFFAELGINVDQAFSYISGAVAFRFDEDAVKIK